jgi:hypothetical protein
MICQNRIKFRRTAHNWFALKNHSERSIKNLLFSEILLEQYGFCISFIDAGVHVVNNSFLGLIVSAFFLSLFVHGGNSLTISLENKSSWPLEWDHTKIYFPGTQIDIEPKTIPPGGKAIITGTTNVGVDLSAKVFFKNNDMLRIDDYQQSRPAQPIFRINSKQIRSLVKDIQFNPEHNPQKLSIVSVVIVLEDIHRGKHKN